MNQIIIIDDNKPIREAAMRVLAKNYTVVAFANPLDALQHILGLSYEPIILCDHDMPEISGTTLYERLPVRFRHRFILHTGDVHVESPSGHIIYKPSSLGELRDAISQVETA